MSRVEQKKVVFVGFRLAAQLLTQPKIVVIYNNLVFQFYFFKRRLKRLVLIFLHLGNYYFFLNLLASPTVIPTVFSGLKFQCYGFPRKGFL